ncbi:MAG: phosphate ABC transporter permease subunit PstC [Candidatus Dormibacteraeota bacterium]|nr:phosphate ABC transporter permease subunit PstC [Candidatus Dormibacteraeota bacterium]
MATATEQAAAPRRPAAGRVDGYRLLINTVSVLVPLALIAIVVVVAQQAAPALAHFGPRFLTAKVWNPVTNQFGALPFIFGTLVTSFIALLLALPIGVGVAVFLAEPSMPRVRGVIGTGVELLAAIPSVVYGIWGLYVLAPWLLIHVSNPLSHSLGRVPIFAGPAAQTNLLIAAVVLAVMVLPTLASISREVVKAVPTGMKESSMALGGTWFETIWKVVLPTARPGIFGATVLALGRALGETIAVAMVIGSRPTIQASLFQPAYTLASVIANEFGEARGLQYGALLALGLILILVTLAVNLGALLLVHRVGRQR